MWCVEMDRGRFMAGCFLTAERSLFIFSLFTDYVLVLVVFVGARCLGYGGGFAAGGSGGGDAGCCQR